MNTTEKTTLKTEATLNAPVEKVWKCRTEPKHITRWNNASDDWHTPGAENDLRPGGKFLYRMEAKDGSRGFDFEGTYQEVEMHKLIAYTLADGRKVQTRFSGDGNITVVTETFEADHTHSLEMQQAGWQAIMDNFKKHVESYQETEKLHFKITIDAPVEKVYASMLDEKKYKEWTAVFNPGSHFKGSWEKGSKILFLGPDEKTGEMGGMVARIKENIPNRFVSIEHLGLVIKGEEVTEGPEVERWAGALENYTFSEEDGRTLLAVDMDANDEFAAFFNETWPKALETLKSICES